MLEKGERRATDRTAYTNSTSFIMESICSVVMALFPWPFFNHNVENVLHTEVPRRVPRPEGIGLNLADKHRIRLFVRSLAMKPNHVSPSFLSGESLREILAQDVSFRLSLHSHLRKRVPVVRRPAS